MSLQENENRHYLNLLRYLEVILKQQKVLKLQTADIIDNFTNSTKNCEDNQLKNIKSNLHDVYLIGCKISTNFKEMINYTKRVKFDQNSNSESDLMFSPKKKKIKKKKEKIKKNLGNFFEKMKDVKIKKTSYFSDLCDDVFIEGNSDHIESEFKLNLDTSNFLNENSDRENSIEKFSSTNLKKKTKFNNKKIEQNDKIRGNYKICSIDVKKEAIRIARIKSIQEAARILNISEKNIKRWLAYGPERKKGAGRKKLDEQMEIKLLIWIEKKISHKRIFPDMNEIKDKAKSLSSIPFFKASKGWYDKFIIRNRNFFQSLTT